MLIQGGVGAGGAKQKRGIVSRVGRGVVKGGKNEVRRMVKRKAIKVGKGALIGALKGGIKGGILGGLATGPTGALAGAAAGGGAGAIRGGLNASPLKKYTKWIYPEKDT